MKTLEALVKQIENENETFEALTIEEKRVVIAQDCIARIKLNQLNAKRGRFIDDGDLNVVRGKNYNDDLLDNNDIEVCSVKEKFNTLPTCSACAKGSLFLTYVGRVNSFNTNEFNLSNNNETTDNAHKKLLEIFSLEQLALIETAFEGIQFIDEDFAGNLIEIPHSKVIKFNKKYEIPNDRMIAICKNIIKNNGTFIIK